MSYYINYHRHSHYSNIFSPDTHAKPKAYLQRMKELGHDIYVCMEHGYSGNFLEAYDLCKEYGYKMVYGSEVYVVPNRLEKDNSNMHMVIICKNKKGFKQLNNILSIANKTGYYYKPRVDLELLLSLNPNDFYITTACVAGIVKDLDLLDKIIKHFGKNLMLEVQSHSHHIQINHNKKVLELAEKYNLDIIHGCDSHYIYKTDAEKRMLFLKGKKINYGDEDSFILDYPTYDEILERYTKQGVLTNKQAIQSIDNTHIFKKCEDLGFNKEVKMPTLYRNKSHKEKMNILKGIVVDELKNEFKQISNDKIKDYKDAVNFEVDIINKTEMEDYFLINNKIINRAKEKGGILTNTGRGSAPSFYVNKLLGFTEIDRLEQPVTLYPTRFMSVSRILENRSLPDIDFNTADAKPFIEASKEILGEDNCYYMIAYGTMQESESFRNLCRAKDIEYDKMNEVAKDLTKYEDDPEWKDIISLSREFIGVIVSASPHPCATLLLSEPISEEMGIIKIGDEFVCNIDSYTSDSWKYLKNDYLVVTVWEIIAETFKTLKQSIPNIRELNQLIKDDDKVWELYHKGMTTTLNQVGSDHTTKMIQQYKPTNVRELTGFISAIRPSFASMLDIFINREKFTYNIPEFDELLKESDNLILFQENIMTALIYAGFAEDATYGLLKAIAKKKTGIIEPIKEQFINGFVSKTGSEEKADKVWQIIEDAVGYGFNSSHALAVAYDSLYGAYLKSNYPLQYYSVVLNIYKNKLDVTDKLIKELDEIGIQVQTIKYGYSKGNYFFDKATNSIYKGISALKGLNETVGNELYELSKKDFDKFIDLLVEIRENTTVKTNQMKILISLNYFDKFGNNKKLMKIYTKFEERYKKTHKDATKVKRLEEIKEYVATLTNESFTVKEQLQMEYEYLGYCETKYDVSNNIFFVIDVNTKYTPKLNLYNLKTGKIFECKCKKNTMKKLGQINPFSLIVINKLTKKPKMRKVGEEWVTMEETEFILEEYQIR